MDTKTIERIGVARVQEIVCSKLHWIFREQVSDDYGVDAHIEIKENCYALGKIIGVQIKAGDSYFNKKGNVGKIVFTEKHYNYWRNYSLPVIIIFVNIKTNKCYWEIFNIHTVEQISNKRYKIVSHENHIFDESAKNLLLKISKGIYMPLPSHNTMKLYKSLDCDDMFDIDVNAYTLLEIEKTLDVIKNLYNDNIQRNLFRVLRKITNKDYSTLDFSGLNLYAISFNNIIIKTEKSQAKFDGAMLYRWNFMNLYENNKIIHISCISNNLLDVWLKYDFVQTWDLNILRCINSRKQKCSIIKKDLSAYTPNKKIYIEVDDSTYYNKIYVINKEEKKVKTFELIAITNVYGCDFSKSVFESENLKELLYQNGAIVDSREMFKDD